MQIVFCSFRTLSNCLILHCAIPQYCYGIVVENERVTWPLDDVKLIKFGPVASSSPTDTNDVGLESNTAIPAGVPNEVIHLVSGQHDEIPQVSCTCVFSSIFIPPLPP